MAGGVVELKIPPPVVALVVALLMWLTARLQSSDRVP
jgi:hypothetical protein